MMDSFYDNGGGGGDYDWRRYNPSRRVYAPQRYRAYDYDVDRYEEEEDIGRLRRRNKTLDFFKNILGSVLVAVVAGLVIRTVERKIARYYERKALESGGDAANRQSVINDVIARYFPK